MHVEGGNWELDPALPISRQILRILRERIIHNDLKPGDRLSESEVARTYDVSRQPVRGGRHLFSRCLARDHRQ